jgi:anti-sigma B factor antagonist
VGQLDITVAAGESGPVLVLTGEADMTTAAELSGALTAQLASGARDLTVDISGLRFADSSSMRALAVAARALRKEGGDMILLRPQPAVARVLRLMSLDQMITVRPATSAGAEPGPT